MTTDIGQSIRDLVDSVEPVTIEEVTASRRVASRTLRRRRPIAWIGLSAAAACAAALVASGVILPHRSGARTVSVSAAPVAEAGTTTTVLSPASSGSPFPGCTLRQPTWDPSAPASIRQQPLPRSYWACPPNLAEEQEVMHSPLPDPALPAGWKLASSTFYYTPSPQAWAVERLWTPTGTPPTAGSQRWIDLRVTPTSTTPRPSNPTKITLAHGVAAAGNVSSGSSTITWHRNGLAYTIRASDTDPAAVLAAANSLG